MTRATLLLATALTALALALACGGEKKKPVTTDDLKAVKDYIDTNMRKPGVTAEARKQYVHAQLGAPHHTSGESQFWYTPASNCYYLQIGEDGWASWGTGATADCKKWAVTP